MSTSRTITYIIALAAALLVMLAAHAATADAHAPRPAACNTAMAAAPPGDRFAAKQRCLVWIHGHNTAHICQRPLVVPVTVRVKGARADRGQRHVIGWIVTEGVRRKLPRVVVWSALMATTQEANARELDGGHGTSAGPFQLINTHGSLADRITVEFSGNWYYNGAAKVYRANRKIQPGHLAQAVERSGHPGAYHQWRSESNRTLTAVLGPCMLKRK